MNGFAATGFYNASFALLFLHALMPIPVLLAVSDRCIKAGDTFQAAQERADQTKRNR